MPDKAPQIVKDDDPNDVSPDFLPIWFVYGVITLMALAAVVGLVLAKSMYG